jgi:hypothetical protein
MIIKVKINRAKVVKALMMLFVSLSNFIFEVVFFGVIVFS